MQGIRSQVPAKCWHCKFRKFFPDYHDPDTGVWKCSLIDDILPRDLPKERGAKVLWCPKLPKVVRWLGYMAMMSDLIWIALELDDKAREGNTMENFYSEYSEGENDHVQ